MSSQNDCNLKKNKVLNFPLQIRQAAVEKKNTKFYNEALKLYKDSMEQALDKDKFYSNRTEFIQLHLESKRNASDQVCR